VSGLETPVTRWRNVYRRHERKLLAAGLFGGVALLFVLGFAPTRVPLLERAETALIQWDDRWALRVAHGEALVKEKRYEEALVYLAALDSVFPARVVKHRRDTERSRLLAALGQTYFALGKKRLTLETYRRLVAFDPRSWQSHHALAMAALELNEPDEAVLHFQEVLKIHPNHLPALRELIGRQVWESNYAAAVATYEAYLKAYQLWPLRLQVGDTVLEIDVPVDGEFHEVEALVPRGPGQADTLRLNPGGLYTEIERVSLWGPVMMGRHGLETATVQPMGNVLWQVSERLGVEPNEGQPAEARIALPPLTSGLERIRLMIRIPKPIDRPLWTVVEQAYRNRLLFDQLRRARERSYILASVDAANLIPVRE
jgi:hypothetical protein